VSVVIEHGSWAVVRTSWVFGRRGTDLVSWAFDTYDKGELTGVLADQVSIPTYAPDLAELLARFATQRRAGLFHVTSGSEAVTRSKMAKIGSAWAGSPSSLGSARPATAARCS
jgi:dTDP-4-dehydrorhamnose reductase